MTVINEGKAKKELVKNTMILAVGQISTKILNFFLLPLYTTLLSTHDYGTVDLLTGYGSILVIILGMQLNQAAFRFLIPTREDENRIKKIISAIIIIQGFVMVCAAVAFGVMSLLLPAKYLLFVFVFVLANIFLQTTSCIARGLGYNANYALGNFVAAVVTLCLNVILIAFCGMGMDGMLIAYSIGPFAGGLLLVIICSEAQYLSLNSFSRETLGEIINYSLPLVPNELSWSVLHTSDRIIISFVLGVAANGLVAVASKLSSIFSISFSVFNNAWTEQVVLHYKDEGGTDYIKKMFEEITILFASLAICLIAVTPLFFSIMIDDKYSEAYKLVPLYIIAVFFNALIGIVSSIYVSQNETKKIAITSFTAAVINVVTNIGLIHFIGIFAAPVSSILGYLTMTVFRLFDINKRHLKLCITPLKIIILIINLSVVLAVFYCGGILAHSIGLVLAIIISIILNKESVFSLISIIRK